MGRRRHDRARGSLYQRTGDIGLLARQLPSMRAWVDHIAGLAGADRLWTGGFQFGDWLDPTAPAGRPVEAKADPDVVATAHLARSAEVVAAAAAAARRRRHAPSSTAASPTRCAEAFAPRVRHRRRARAQRRADRVRAGARVGPAADRGAAPARRRPARRPGPASRLPDQHRLRRHAADHRRADRASATLDVAYRLLLQTGCPSWLYPVTMGATTVWERWDSMLPDGSINPGEMTSFNHYALGRGRRLAAPHGRRARPGGTRLPRAARPARGPAARPDHAPRRGTRRPTARPRCPGSGRRAGSGCASRPGRRHAPTVHVPGEPSRSGRPRHPRVGRRRPGASTGAVPARATIRDLLDHEPTWGEVVAAAVETGVASRRRRGGDTARALLDEPVEPTGRRPRAPRVRRRR